MSNDCERLNSSYIDDLTNGSLLSCYRWATRRRRMGGDLASKDGFYSAKYHPWVVEMHNSWAPYNYAMKGAQLGVTETAINRALYIIDKMKRNVLYLLPTSLTASDFSKARFGGALALSPYLKSMFTDTNSVNLKQAGQNTLYIRGSRGDSNLISIDVSELIFDEVDRMEEPKVLLALERLSGQLHKHVWGISTPTIPEFGIHRLYSGSTQEHFIFKCPRCSRLTEFVWPDCVQICGEHVTDPRCKDSFLKCRECKGRIEQEEKPEFLKTAYWQSMDPNANPEVRGFYINQLYSFTITAGELAVAYFRGVGDELANKEFYNSKLGLPFIGDGAKVDDTMIRRCIGGHSKDDARPDRAGRIITMGVDRGKWNHIVICEWFFSDYGMDLNASAKCKVLWEGKVLDEDFDKRLDELMREWQVLACVVDADPGRMEARRFARRFAGFVWLCQYRKGVTAKEISIADEDDGAPIATVERSNWLSASLGRFKTDPSRIELPRDVSEEFRSHMKSLVSTYVRDDYGNPMLDFVKTGGADHFAHALTYAEIALPLCAAREQNRDIKKFL